MVQWVARCFHLMVYHDKQQHNFDMIPIFTEKVFTVRTIFLHANKQESISGFSYQNMCNLSTGIKTFAVRFHFLENIVLQP